MRITFQNQFAALKEILNLFDPASNQVRLSCLKNLHALPLRLSNDLPDYFEALLFILAYPANSVQRSLAEKEMLRLTRFLQKAGKEINKLPRNTGIPFTPTITRFTHDKVRWLMTHPHCTVSLDAFVDPSHTLNDVLKLTLPTIERAETTAGLENLDLMDSLKIPATKRLWFLVNELARLDDLPYIKDHLFDRLEPIVRVTPKDRTFSKAYNRLPVSETYFHQDLLKKIDPSQIVNQPVPAPVELDEIRKEEVIRVIKNAMVLTARETDPCTYMEEGSLRLYPLERGISIAIFGMVPARQMPLESYVGYTAFKNGFPVSYGGSWIFGPLANFGINIFKPYRSGESAYIMAQLLRVYRNVFRLSYFEVEPYQYGLDNPDGIASGAFWFYYRFGFRPLDKRLKGIAEKEAEKIKSRKGYRTSPKILTDFTGSNIALNLGGRIPQKVAEIAVRVTGMIQRNYKGNRILAETDCRQKFMMKTGISQPATSTENHVLTEVALWAEAMHIEEKAQQLLLADMIKTKPKDVYAYQDVLLRFFAAG